jgi:DNA gyrase subunit A
MRCGVDEVRIAARKTMGVTVFRVAEDERVVSVAAVPSEEQEERMAEEAAGDEGDEGDAGAPDGGPDETGSGEAT